jgi:DNA-binding transcriptional LysR family regulator
LEAIDAERSFHGAADRLGYVQSAVSQQLSTLERLVGARLVDRQRGHAAVELTEAGIVVLHHAQKILRQLDAARADLAAVANAESQAETLRVGSFESVAIRVVPRVLARMQVRRPALRILTSEAPGDGDLFERVAQGILDCAFADLPLQPGPFDAVELLLDTSMLLVPSDWELAQRAKLPTLREIAQLPLATANWRIADFIERRFAMEGLVLKPVFELETNAAARATVSAGFAAAIMPRLAVEPETPGTTAIPLDGLLPPRTIVLYWHRDRLRTPALESFIDECRSVCRGLGSSGSKGPQEETSGGSGQAFGSEVARSSSEDDGSVRLEAIA